MTTHIRLLGAALFGLVMVTLNAQTPAKIVFLSDAEDASTLRLEEQIRKEISALLAARFVPSYETIEIESAATFAAVQEQVYQGDADAIIGIGFEVSNYLSRQASYPKPTIIGFMLDNRLQGLPLPVEGKSGIENLAYVQSPFDLKKDLATLYEIKPYEKLGLLFSQNPSDNGFDLQTYLEQLVAPKQVDFEILQLDETAEAVLSQVSSEVDAVYVFPVLEAEKQAALGQVLNSLASRGIPTFSMIHEPTISLGAYAAFEMEDNFARIPRRIAINTLKIMEGQLPASLAVEMETYTKNLIINMQAARASKIYPSWDMMAEAVLVNVTLVDNNSRQISLQTAVAEGLNNNLLLKAAEKDVAISAQDVSIAKSNYLPQLDATGLVSAIDDNTVSTSFGFRGRYNLQADANLSQLLLSEPALANIAIQKLLLKGQEEVLRQNQLDIVADVTAAYLNILQATAIVKLRNENVAVTRQNLDIAKTKEQVGFSGPSDVYRFESELAFDNVDLNNAQAQWRQARFGLNNLLNRPIKEDFSLADVGVSDSITLVTDPRLFNLITNPGDVETFADFLVKEAMENLPELQQLNMSKLAQERSLLSQKRAFYLPTVALTASSSFPLGQYSYPETVMPMDVPITWNAGVAVQLPIFQGNSRRFQKQQTEVGILQLNDQLGNLKNNLELQVRANMETAGASFSNLALSQRAVEASRKNFEIAQNSYQQGLLNITSLIDAQNALLQSEINAINAEYTFINDFIAVERSIGYFHFLAPDQDKDAFFQRFAQFILNK